MQQFEVIKAAALLLGRMVETHVSEAVGHHVPAIYEYSPKARQGSGSVSIHLLSMREGYTKDREYEALSGGEQFRAAPLSFTARYMISAWARPPEDQALLGAVLRTFLDHPTLDVGDDDEEDVVAYAGVPGITTRYLGLEEHQLLASGLEMPLAPSVSYELDLRLRSQQVSPIKRVRERVVDFRKIEG